MKKIIAFILMFVLVLSVPMGCKQEEPTDEKESTKVELIDAELVSGFNSYDEIRQFAFSTYFGIAKINTDTKYITEGDGSIKLTILDYNDEETIKIFTGTEFNALKDYTNVRALTLDVYNPSEANRNIYINFGTRFAKNDRAVYPKKQFIVKPGWNTIIYQIDRAVSNSTTYIDKVEYVGIEFDLNNVEPYDIYLDNLVAHFDDSKIVEKTIEYAQNELFFFEDSSFLSGVKTETDMCYVTELGSVSLCRNPLFIRSGIGALQIEVATNSSPSRHNAPGLRLTGEAIERVDWTKIDSIEFYTCSSVTTTAGSVRFAARDENSTRVLYLSMKEYNEEFKKDGGMLRGKWYKTTIKLSDLEGLGLDVETIKEIIFFYYSVKTPEERHSIFIDDITLVPKTVA